MTKKDYVLIAKAIQENMAGISIEKGEVGEGIAISLAGYFKKENPRFDYYKFLKACGV